MVSDPNLAILLISLGVLSITAEFCLPGKVIPAVLGAIFVTLGLSSLPNAAAPINWPLTTATIAPMLVIIVVLLRIALRARRNKLSVP